MTRSRFNEGKALDAVIRHIEARDGVQRGNNPRYPEREGHAAPVELVCTIGDELYAFEHTGIEPFPNQIADEENSRRLFRRVSERLVGRLPPKEWFQLHVPIGATIGIRRNEVAAIQACIEKWVLEIAPTLPIAPYGRYVLPIIKTTLPEVPFAVTLHRIAAPTFFRGRFDVLHLAPNDIESARRDRLRKACHDKYPKLAAWKLTDAARTVLVLEDGDIQLTNEQRIYEALVDAESARTDAPDEIYVVNTTIDNPWWVTCIRRTGKTYFDEGERFWEVDSATLVALTQR